MNIISKLRDLLKRCKQDNNPNELPLSDDTRKLIRKSEKEILDEMVRESGGGSNETYTMKQTSMRQVEMTRRLIVELRNFNRTTTRFSYVLVFLTVVQILLALNHC